MRLGRACPESDFPTGLPEAERHLFVKPGATGGTGSREAPFGTIREAVRRATPGTAVVLARGRYAESVDVWAGVTLVGACVAETVLAPTAGDAAVRLSEMDAGLVDLTVAPETGGGIWITSKGRLENVAVDGATGYGIVVQGGGSVSGTAVVVRGTRTAADGRFGRGFDVTGGASATLTRVLFEDNASGAVAAAGEGTRLVVSGLAARRNGEADHDARQLATQDGSYVEVRAGVVEEHWGTGLGALGRGAELVLEDVVFRGARARGEGAPSGGGVVGEGARVELRRVRFEGSEAFGVSVIRAGSASFEDLVVRGTTRGVPRAGIAVGVGEGAAIEGHRLWLEGNEGAGLMVSGPGTRVELEDVHISRTGMPEDRSIGIGVGGGAELTLRRLEMAGTVSAGVLVTSEGTRLEAEDLVIADTDSQGDGTFGRAIEVQAGAEASVSRGLLTGNREISAMAATGARLWLSGVRLEDTRARGCSSSTCVDAPGGTGLGAYSGAWVMADGFTVHGAALCGVQVASGADILLSNGEIAGAPVGACVQVEGFDLSRVTGGVTYRDNGVNVDATRHAVPTPSSPLPDL